MTVISKPREDESSDRSLATPPMAAARQPGAEDDVADVQQRALDDEDQELGVIHDVEELLVGEDHGSKAPRLLEDPLQAPSPSSLPSPSGPERDGSLLDVQTTRRRAPMKNPSRERKKAELAWLRQTVAALQKELKDAALQNKKRREDERWREEAASQLAKRQRAEVLNTQLREVVKDHLAIARNLERAVLEFSIDGGDQVDPVQVGSAQLLQRNHDAFARLEQDTVDAYALVDQVLLESNMADAKVSFTSAQATLRTSLSDGLPYVELVDTKLIPFDLARSCEALWLALQTDAVSDHHQVREFTTTADTVRITSLYPLRLQNGRVHMLDFVVVMKCFREPSRMVVVWRSITETLDKASSSLNASAAAFGGGSDETGWMVVREMASAGDRAGLERSCVLQTLSRHAPLSRAAWESADDAAQRLLLNSTEDDIANVTTAMANLLVADALDTVASR